MRDQKAIVRFRAQKRVYFFAGALGIVLAVFVIKTWAPSVWGPIRLFLLGLPSAGEVVRDLAPEVRPELESICRKSGISYPPSELALIALKKEKVLEVWGRGEGNGGQWKHLVQYRILGSSGRPGPKLREGDMQVPEGRYSVTSLNPNSNFHLSMKLDYPNRFDRKMAQQDGRQDPGNNIFIHGSDVSVGCLAMGNDSIEKLFVLVYDTGAEDTDVIIAPYDLTGSEKIHVPGSAPQWTHQLYEKLHRDLEAYKGR
ncbi:MAG: L,D-transpeptidase family protein [Desulfobacteraceae bacterium]|nr:L,D-transpeptidase family protein [Desulfobacteraceae bacterium]